MTNPVIEREFTTHTYFKQRLAQEFPDADGETLADTLEGLSNLGDQLAALIRSALEDEVLLEALRQRISDMRERASRLGLRSETKRRLVAEFMERAELRRIIQDDFTVSLRPPQRTLVITNEAEIPDNFWKPQSPKLDRQGLLDYLKGGSDALGVCLGNGKPSITVRTK